MLDPVKNFAKVTVSTGYDSTATSIDLVTGDGAKLPDPATEGAFNLVWWNATDYPDPADDPNVEIVRVTAKSGDTLTITRGQEGTSAQNHNTAGKAYKMILAPTKKMIDDIGNSLVSALNDLGDVSISTPSAGQYFRYDGANWVNSAIQLADLPAISLNDLSDVSITSPADGEVLTYNATTGQWENQTAAGGGFTSRVRAHKTTNQNISDRTWTKVTFQAVDYDGNSEYNTSQHRFVASEGGYYLVHASLKIYDQGQYGKVVAIYKNGTKYSAFRFYSSYNWGGGIQITDIVPLSANDYIEIWVYFENGVTIYANDGEATTWLAIHRLS